MIIKPEMVSALAKGAALLGSGGGQNPDILIELVSRELSQYGGVSLIKVDSLPDNALVVPVEYMGAPNPEASLKLDGCDLEALIKRVELRFMTKIDAILTGEIGGANGLVGLLIAARLRLPLIDGDAVGRALPKLSMNTPSLFGIKPTPAFLAAEGGETIIEIETASVSSLENICRSLSRSFGGNAAFIFNIMTGLEAKKAIVKDTLSQALILGEQFSRGEIIGTLLCKGELSNIALDRQTGFLRGFIEINDDGKIINIDVMNEYMRVKEDGNTIAEVPDIITMVNDKQIIITSDIAVKGMNVSLFKLEPPIIWLREDGLVLLQAAQGL